MMKRAAYPLLCAAIPFLALGWRIFRGVKCEAGSLVHPSCRFEGRNRICRGSELSGCRLGFGSYVGEGCRLVSAAIGRYASVGPNVRITCGTHPTDFVSTHPAFFSLRKQAGFTYVSEQLFDEGADGSRPTEIGNDVWIGDSALILGGVKIGDGAVIAAGAVVTKDVPPYTVAAGSPASVVRTRFPPETVEKLLRIRWWDRGEAWIREHAAEFADAEAFAEKYGAFPPEA